MTATFVVEFTTTSASVHGYGKDAEGLVARCETTTRRSPELQQTKPEEYRDDIKVFEAELGKGYVQDISNAHGRKLFARQ
jgi:hypothetical protein